MERLIQRKALNLQSYSTYDGFNERGLISDVGALATEVGKDRPTEERVFKTLEAVVNGQIVNFPVNKQKDVREMFENDSPESTAGMKIAQFLLDEPEGTMFAWLSPKGGIYEYEEARIRVGVVKRKIGFKILESYGIPVDFDNEKMVNIFYRLQEFSDKEPQSPTSPDDLRDKIVIFSPSENNKNRTNWLDFLDLKEVLPELKIVWQAIKRGGVAEFNRRAKREAREEVENVLQKNEVNIYLHEQDAVRIGAQIERGMIDRGWGMVSMVCGMLNSDLLNQSSLLLSVNVIGGRISIGIEMGKFVKNCGQCGKSINKVISKGYQCECGGVYKGC